MFFLFVLGTLGTSDWINEILIFNKSFYVATMGGVYKMEKVFKPINKGFLNLNINSIAVDKKNRLYAGCEDGLYRLEEKRWIKILNEPFVNKIFINKDLMIIGTNIGRVLRSNNEGKSFELVLELPSAITAITSDGKTLYISSYNNGIYKSYDGGINWKRIDFKGIVWDILPFENTLLVASEDGLKRGTFSYWEDLNKGLTTKRIRVITKDKDTLYLGSYIGGLFISHNKGKKWESENTGLYNTNIRDIVISGDTIYVATENGLYKRQIKGNKFERINEGFVYPSKVHLLKTPEEIKKRKEKLGIKLPTEEKGKH